MTIDYNEAYVQSEVEHMHVAEYNQFGEFSSEELARIDYLECDHKHARSGAMQIIVEHLERAQIKDLIGDLYGHKLSIEDMDRLGAVLRVSEDREHGFQTIVSRYFAGS